MENQNIQIQQVEQVKKIKKVLTRAQEIERSIVKKFKKDIWRNFTKAINEYQMIQDGDKIAVCISRRCLSGTFKRGKSGSRHQIFKIC